MPTKTEDILAKVREGRVWQSVFRSGTGSSTLHRALAIQQNVFLHLFSTKVRTRMLGPVAYPVDPAVVDKNTNLLANPDRQELRSTRLVWPALLRKVDRLDPGYKN